MNDLNVKTKLPKGELDDSLLDQVTGGTDSSDTFEDGVSRICPLCGERVVTVAPPPDWVTDKMPRYTCVMCEFVIW